MFKELLNTQVCCYKDGKLDQLAFDCLKFMYPNFKIVKTEFDIFPGEPFIYIGDIKWVYKIQKHTEPHIILATTGEYNLTDRKVLIELAYKKYNKSVPKYLEDSELVKNWDNYQFMYNWKYIWITGSPVDKVEEQNTLFLDLLDSLSTPAKALQIYTQALQKYGNMQGTSYLEKALISFIKKSRNITNQNTKNDRMLRIRTTFVSSFDKNVHNATMNFLTSPNKNESLKFMDFLLDLIWVRR